MIIKCFRCKKDIDKPGLTAVLDENGKPTGECCYNADYIIAKDTKDIELDADGTPKEVQKTGIICPECFNPETDFVIWGAHKNV